MITSETTTAISPTVALILSWAPKNHSPQCRLSYFYKNTSTISYLPCWKLSYGSRHIQLSAGSQGHHPLPFSTPSPEFRLHGVPVFTTIYPSEGTVYSSLTTCDASLLPKFWIGKPWLIYMLYMWKWRDGAGSTPCKMYGMWIEKGNFPQVKIRVLLPV